MKGTGLELGKLQNLILKGGFGWSIIGKILFQLAIGKSADKGSLSLVLDTTDEKPLLSVI